jgi:hypothetical protein
MGFKKPEKITVDIIIQSKLRKHPPVWGGLNAAPLFGAAAFEAFVFFFLKKIISRQKEEAPSSQETSEKNRF